MKKTTAFIVLSVMLGTLLYSLDQLIVATAMPKIVLELNGLSQLSWVFTAYMLTSTITIPIYGKLSDIYGRKVFYIIGIVIFLVGSLLSGIAQSMTQLILFRALQGIGGGAMMVNAQAIIGDIFPPAERGRWQGLNMSMYGLATIAGPLLGGWLTDNFSWRWVFFINIPIGILAIGIVVASMPQLIHQARDRTIDFAGAFLIAIGLLPLLLAFVWGGSEYPWVSWQVLGLLAVAVVVLFAFVLTERRAREPIVSLSLFRNKAYTISVVIVFLTMIGMYGALLYIPLFAQGVVGVSATNSGLILMPMMVGLIIASVLAGQIVSQTGKYKALTIVGMVVTVLAMAFFTQIGTGTSNASLSWRMVILGIGIGIGMPIFTTVAQSAFGPERLGEVTAGKQLFQNIGGTVSTAILGGVMNNQLAHQLIDIQNDPFVATIKQLNPAAALTKIDVNTIQQYLSAEGQAQIKAILTQAPQAMQDQLVASLSHFLNTIKTALSYAVDHMFIVSTILMGVALFIVFFLPQIPLRKRKSQTLEEIELEVGHELGAQSDAEYNQDH
jgi:EmrB/QacA subfamily drug resistance transporter